MKQPANKHLDLQHCWILVVYKIRPHRFGGEGVLIGVQSATLNAQVTFVYIAVAISALAGGGGPQKFRTETVPLLVFS